MGKQRGHIVFIGTIDNLCFYKAEGKYLVRKASCLTGKKVKTHQKFRRTMEEAGLFGKASGIASVVYQSLPKSFRQYWMFRAFAGEAFQSLRKGKSVEEVTMMLWKTYAAIWVEKEAYIDAPAILVNKEKAPAKTKRVVLNNHTRWSVYKHEEEIFSSFSVFLSSESMVKRRRAQSSLSLSA